MLSRLNTAIIVAAVLLIPILPSRAVCSEDGEDKAAQILNDLGRRAFRWFGDNRNPRTGLIRDRGPNWKGRAEPSAMASIASAGYYLSLLPEAVRLGQITRAEARQHAWQMLDFVKEKMGHENGLLFHFIDWETGKRWDKSEVSALDSAIFFNGCMVAAEAFGGRVAELANRLVDRAAWSKFVIEHPQTKKKLLALGWTPEAGLFGPAEVRSSEMAMAYFLAIGARTNAIDPECWYNTAVSYRKVSGYLILNGEQPLFTSYYGLGWHDLKGKTDRAGVNLEANARSAALANRAFGHALGQDRRSYRQTEGLWWGISAGDSPAGYIGPGPIPGAVDGTVWPTAALAAIPWIPKEIHADLLRWRASRTWQQISGDYGLSPFNLDKNWIGNDVIGIDLGSFSINLANYRNRTVWDLWMRHPVAASALRKLGF